MQFCELIIVVVVMKQVLGMRRDFEENGVQLLFCVMWQSTGTVTPPC